MLETDVLGKAKFLGRDGFRWWIGQVAPRDAQPDQINDGEGWASRYKVRIMGYHPFTESPGIPNEDLPWAICLLPTTVGSGSANYSKSTQLQQGDIVFGFFLDGDDAQIPAILGHFGRATGVEINQGTEEFSTPFVPFTGFTEVTPAFDKIKQKETGEQNAESQITNTSANEGTFVDQNGSGRKEITPDTCSPTPISRMSTALENMADRIDQFKLTGMALEAEIDAVADLIETQSNAFVGRMFDFAYDELEGKLQDGLEKLYNDTFGKVFAQTGNSPQSYAVAHAAGRAAQIGEIPKIKNAENALSCVANKVVEGLRGTVSDMLKDLLASGLGLAGCVTTNFAANFLNNITNNIADAMKLPLADLSNILDGFDIGDLLRGSALAIEDFGGFLDCGQTNKDKCPPIRKYEVSGGPMEKGADPFAYVSYAMNKQSKGGGTKGLAGIANQIDSLADGLGGITDGIGGIVDAVQNPSALVGGLVKSKFGNLIPSGVTNSLGSVGRISGLIDDLSSGGSCTGGKQNCGNPTMQIFGGGGIGAIGNVVLGNFIENTPGLTTLADSVSRTAGIIGANITVPGRNYRTPPAISFADKCGKGYGAHGEAIIDENGQIVGVVITSTGEGYPIVEEGAIDDNVGVTTVFVQDPGTGYTPGDSIIEENLITIVPKGGGFRDPDTQDTVDEEQQFDPATGEPIPSNVVSAGAGLVPETDLLINVSNKPTYELVIDPVTGGINSIKVLNILKFESQPIFTIKTKTGEGAILRPIFGPIPEERQQGVLTVVDCVRGSGKLNIMKTPETPLPQVDNSATDLPRRDLRPTSSTPPPNTDTDNTTSVLDMDDSSDNNSSGSVDSGGYGY